MKRYHPILSRFTRPPHATPCGGSVSWGRCRPVATPLGNRRSSRQWLREHRTGKRRWSRLSKSTNAVGGRIASRYCCGKKAARCEPSAPTHCDAPTGPTGLASQGIHPAHELRCVPNRLLDQPSRVRASGITCPPLANDDRTCRCAWVGVASKQVVDWQVVDWQIGATMPEKLVTRTLQRTFWPQSLAPGPLRGTCRALWQKVILLVGSAPFA